MLCGTCQIECVVETRGVPSPHTGEYVCPRCGEFRGWVRAEWTIERARAFVMPIGRYKGQTVEQIAEHDREWLEWAARTLQQRGPRAACQTFLNAKPQSGAECGD